MESKNLPLSLLEKKPLTYSFIDMVLNIGFWSIKRAGCGPTYASKLGLKNIAIEILSFSEFTVALCSTLLYNPLLNTCKTYPNQFATIEKEISSK